MQQSRTAVWRIREPRASSLVELMLACAVVTILGTRAYLALSGYPQVGGATLHIAHMLWGGLCMLIAALILFQAADRIWKPVMAVLFGAGFGLFLDEIGKFVTKDNDYFFKPSVAIIYVVMVVILLSARLIAQIDKRPPEEYLYFATEVLARSWLGPLPKQQRAQALNAIDHSGIVSPKVEQLRTALKNCKVINEPDDNSWHEWDTFWKKCRLMLAGKNFQRIIFAVIILHAAAYTGVVFIVRNPSLPHTFAEWLNLGWQIAVALLLFLGVIAWARRKQLSALKFFYYAMLIMLLIGQVFTFASSEFYGLIDLTVNVAILVGLRGSIESQAAKQLELAGSAEINSR